MYLPCETTSTYLFILRWSPNSEENISCSWVETVTIILAESRFTNCCSLTCGSFNRCNAFEIVNISSEIGFSCLTENEFHLPGEGVSYSM